MIVGNKTCKLTSENGSKFLSHKALLIEIAMILNRNDHRKSTE